MTSCTSGFEVVLGSDEQVYCQAVVVATGGLSIPTMGASPYGYQLARQFGIKVLPTRAGLVPFTLQPTEKERFGALSGVSLPCHVQCNGQSFELDLLFTHRGMSGPAMLQISSYWQPGDALIIDLDPNQRLEDLSQQKRQEPRKRLKHCLLDVLPKRVMNTLFTDTILDQELGQFSEQVLLDVKKVVKQFQIKPNGTEGYRTAEVTLGGVDTHAFLHKPWKSHLYQDCILLGRCLM